MKSKIAIIDEKIRKSTLYSPADARVAEIFLEVGEPYVLGTTAVSLATATHKIQADISELDIGKIRALGGNDVSVKLDAFPDKTFASRVVSVDPRAIVKDEDKYYRVNFIMNEHDDSIRAGMNADLVVMVSFRKDVLRVPELAVYKKDDKEFVRVLENGAQREAGIETGISDGDYFEVVSGLSEGQILAVSVE